MSAVPQVARVPAFYWEFDATGRAPGQSVGDWLLERFSPDVPETVLLMQINHGRTLHRILPNWDHWDALLPEVPLDGFLEDPRRAEGPSCGYVESIAALLQAAAYKGLDGYDLCMQALASQLDIWEDAVRSLEDVERGHCPGSLTR